MACERRRVKVIGVKSQPNELPRQFRKRRISEPGPLQLLEVLVEAGPGLVRPMADAGLVDLAWVFTAPHALGDVGEGGDAPIARAALEPLPCWWRGMRGPDRVAVYRLPA